MGANRRARRLRTLDGKRLGVVVDRPGGSTPEMKRATAELLARIAVRIGKAYDLAGVRTWRKTRTTPSTGATIDEVASSCDAVIMGIGDCRHASAFSLTDAFELERRGVRVAYIDTPGRMPRVSRRAAVFDVHYAYLDTWVYKWDPDTPKGRQQFEYQFHTQGISRALRQAGCRAGDGIALGARDFEAWPRLLEPGTGLPDAIPGYEYVVTEPLSKEQPLEIARRDARLTPRVIDALVIGP